SARRSNVATALRFLVLLWLAAHGRAQPLPEPGAPVRADQVRSGSLLIKTDQPGVFLPAPALETEVAIRVTGIVARASVRQRFANTAGDCVEGVYVFPLPENAAVDRMRMTAGQRVIEAEIRERVEAKKIYEQAKADGKKASLLEQERPNIFTASVASIGPNETVQIEIEYQETLRFDEGKFHLRFPMVVAPRYDPGSVSPDPPVAARAVGLPRQRGCAARARRDAPRGARRQSGPPPGGARNRRAPAQARQLDAHRRRRADRRHRLLRRDGRPGGGRPGLRPGMGAGPR